MAFKSTILLCALAAASLAPAADNAPGMLAAGRVDDAINTLQGEIRSSPQDAKLQNLLCRAYFSLEECVRPRQLLGYVGLKNGGALNSEQSFAVQLGISFLWGYAFIHYYLDSKIWRVRRDPSVGKALNMS